MKIDISEQERLDAVHCYNLIDAPHGAFDRITKLTARLLKAPIALVTVVDTDNIWYLSHYGTDAQKIPKELGLCSQVILNNAPFLVEDASTDSRLAGNECAAQIGLKFFAAVPLTVKSGHNLGTLCVIDTESRKFTTEDMELLKDLAAIVVDELELRFSMKRVLELETEAVKNAISERDKAKHIAYHDSLTGLPNRLFFMNAIERELEKLAEFPSEDGKVPAVLMLDLDKFKSVNDTLGHQAGDMLLKEVSKRIKHCVSGNDTAARLGGDEFIILKREATQEDSVILADMLVNNLSMPYDIEGKILDHVSASVGMTLYHPRDNSRQLIRNADLALYCAKNKGRKNFQFYNTSIDNSIQTRHRS